eukprot:2543363-Amphidinium_carterae.1
MNQSGFETWCALHATYNQGKQTQKLHTLQRSMKATWHNESQQPHDFIQQFNLWRDELFQYDETTGTRRKGQNE